MAFTPHTPADVEAMLAAIGAKSLDDLFSDVPEKLLLKEPLPIDTLTEYEAQRRFESLAAQNRVYPAAKAFLGAGAYRHFIPAAALQLIARGEFMTSYTPYQAEVSQGTLQAVFEFQSHICALTAMEVANASMYDGATALAEAITMAMRETGRKVAWLPELLHPYYRRVCDTFLGELDIEVRTIPSRDGLTDMDAVDGEAAAVVVQTPNALGCVENGHEARAAATRAKALLVAVVNPTSLGVLAPPGEYGADIAVGEGQPLGIPVSFGGPYAGFFACKKSMIRKMPGRIVGRAQDAQGRDGFVLTLQTREQHIRRDKATSNICTNQGLFALLATMYLSFMGKQGIVEVAETSLARTRQLVDGLTGGTEIVRLHEAPYFHECALKLPVSAREFLDRMRDDAGILAGFALERWYPNWPDAERLLLVNCTEVHLGEDVAEYVQAARSVLASLRAPV
ncbi:MAG: aminomethyl-transferring glycine dehydrogenase subunit GcvPA [Candidatus Sumerlaeia bacterium]|nr:aminomethyl-transferring glycine dehydrogenase subunit GcvPA [Candidatus Sumerlaeia bacterium]